MILDDKYEKSDLNKVMENQCQHMKEVQCKKLLKLLQKIEELFVGTLGTWKTDLVKSELNEDNKSMFWRPYPVPKVQEEVFKNNLNV